MDDPPLFTYDEVIQEQDVPGTKNNNDKFLHQDREVEQQPYLAVKHGKAQQRMLGFFNHIKKIF